jgi:hypothetical protein
VPPVMSRGIVAEFLLDVFHCFLDDVVLSHKVNFTISQRDILPQIIWIPKEE